MDLQLFSRVVWRFRALIAAGLLLACLLAFLSFVRVGFAGGHPRVTYREQEQYESLSEVFVTTRGFPWGSLSEAVGTNPGSVSTPDAGRLSSLATLYLELATTDGVLKRLHRTGPVHGIVRAFPVFPGGNSDNSPLPLVTLSAVSHSPSSAQQLGQRYLAAFGEFIAHRQAGADIRLQDRVRLETVREPTPGKLLQARKKTRPILIFVTVMLAVLGLAFILENARPRIRKVAAEPDQRVDASITARRSA
jgi:hypothetical protein